MPLAVAYHRPHSTDEAVELLSQADHVALAGGTWLNADRDPSRLQLVDLQGLALDTIDTSDNQLMAGAMVTLSRLVDDERVPAAIRAFAQAELPSTLRTRATVGGTVAWAGSESLLFAGLLAQDSTVNTTDRAGVALADFSPAPGELITGLAIGLAGDTSWATTGRTPADVPIVAAVACRSGGDVKLALTGVAERPVLVDPDDPTKNLQPPTDFRGSSEYRLELAATLSARALEDVR